MNFINQAKKIINDSHLTNQIIDLMRNAIKAIMEIYNDNAKKSNNLRKNSLLIEADLASKKFFNSNVREYLSKYSYR